MIKYVNSKLHLLRLLKSSINLNPLILINSKKVEVKDTECLNLRCLVLVGPGIQCDVLFRQHHVRLIYLYIKVHPDTVFSSAP